MADIAGLPARKRQSRTRGALIEAGLALLADRAIEAITVDEIVAAAQVAKGSFFYHFADKFAFAETIAASLREEAEASVTAVNRSIADPAERMLRGIAQFIRFGIDQSDKAKIVLRVQGAALDPGSYLNIGLRRDVEEAMEAGRIEAQAVGPVILNVIALTQLLVTLASRTRQTQETLARQYCELLLIMLKGLGMTPGEAERLLRKTSEEVLLAGGGAAPAA